jgi:hypothetical protein
VQMSKGFLYRLPVQAALFIGGSSLLSVGM